ncbi:acyl-CoA carboxylase epsilon subunit [Streptomyces sp. G-G2]|uniref:acyl-CoA carboxylase epsilon subunit n=1 Tax=Streptomyces sp. G-G2 TaxID=3046201 RepID=UPI0024BA6A25|nr:acyl-CoA carboxylase epsilon subunit [Streptomyces sp. G-G2]MDJ0384768.1 acyl-CoA carboxylase epsilon subunit [Streptomyces sp. G-G2]
MTAGEQAPLWRVVKGRPDAAETAAVAVVLALLAGRQEAGAEAEGPRGEPVGWGRTERGSFRSAGAWRTG